MTLTLRRTWAALAVAAVAVLFVAFLAGRDFVRDVYPECGGTLEPVEVSSIFPTENMIPVALDTSDGASAMPDMPFQLRYDTKLANQRIYPNAKVYSNVRVVHNDVATDGKPCECGSVPVLLSGEGPGDLSLFRDKDDLYVLKGRTAGSTYVPHEVRASFRLKPGATRHLQTDRILAPRHLSLLIVWLAFGALAVAALRARRANSYATQMHAWTEAELNDDGMIADENGATIATLEQGRVGLVAAGPILVAPTALSTSGLYRDMPIVAYGNVAEGDHARWARGTMLRLRDARALAVLSALATVGAFAARALA